MLIVRSNTDSNTVQLIIITIAPKQQKPVKEILRTNYTTPRPKARPTRAAHEPVAVVLRIGEDALGEDAPRFLDAAGLSGVCCVRRARGRIFDGTKASARQIGIKGKQRSRKRIGQKTNLE
jgi:hypothetical protein